MQIKEGDWVWWDKRGKGYGVVMSYEKEGGALIYARPIHHNLSIGVLYYMHPSWLYRVESEAQARAMARLIGECDAD